MSELESHLDKFFPIKSYNSRYYLETTQKIVQILAALCQICIQKYVSNVCINSIHCTTGANTDVLKLNSQMKQLCWITALGLQ